MKTFNLIIFVTFFLLIYLLYCEEMVHYAKNLSGEGNGCNICSLFSLYPEEEILEL